MHPLTHLSSIRPFNPSFINPSIHQSILLFTVYSSIYLPPCPPRPSVNRFIQSLLLDRCSDSACEPDTGLEMPERRRARSACSSTGRVGKPAATRAQRVQSRRDARRCHKLAEAFGYERKFRRRPGRRAALFPSLPGRCTQITSGGFYRRPPALKIICWSVREDPGCVSAAFYHD